MKSVFKSTWPYQGDAMNLPVESVDQALPFYESVMGFQVASRNNSPHKSAVLARDDIKI
jgi:predicted enzyme related to lactoylglutathione lyase